MIGLVVAALAPPLSEIVPRLIERLGPNSPVMRVVGRGGAARLPSLAGAAGWLGGRAAGEDSLALHPVVLAIFTDTDPRSAMVLRGLEAWHEAYARYGVRVVGVHHPQYAFAADSAVPARFARRLRLEFPIAIDPQRRIDLPPDPADSPSAAPSDRDAPRFAVADARGSIVFRGGLVEPFDLSAGETAIRRELRRWRPGLGFPAEPERARAPDEPAMACVSVALGARPDLRGPLANVKPGAPQTFVAPFRFDQEGEPLTPYPVGSWTLLADGLAAARGGAANFLAIRYADGRSALERVGVVASPPRSGAARLWILRDEAWLPADALGDDAMRDARGASYVEVTEPRLYILARGSGEHVLKLSPDAPGLTLHALTFDNTSAVLAPR